MSATETTAETATETRYRTCPLCEATCGLALEVADERVIKIRGDSEDVFSHGFLCPKAHGLMQLREDPDRVRTPLVRVDGELREASWEEAFARVDELLTPILAEDRNAVAAYVGNPNAHNLSSMVYLQVLLRALGSRNAYSASSVDQMPKHFTNGHMFGGFNSLPVPDVDRTSHLLILGANPLVSNGSLLTAPDMRGRIRAIRERGGKVVVIDPRRTRTAEVADKHHFIRPGTDALLLMAIVNTLFAEDLVKPGRLLEHTAGIEQVEELASSFTPESAAGPTGIDADEIKRLAREFAGADSAACYGRIGTTTQEFGTIASWLVDVVNVLTGNLDRPGGAMFTRAAAGQSNSSGVSGRGKGARTSRWASRVRGAGETIGELPVSCLAEEIDTPGEGQVRALITVAGNPLLSTPNADRLRDAVEGLEAMVCIDIYLNETSRHADVVLPAPDPLARPHYDLALYQFAARNVAHYSPKVLEPDEGLIDEWRVLATLTGIVTGQGPGVDVEALDSMVIATVVGRDLGSAASRLGGRTQEEILAELEPRIGPERVLDFLLRSGPHGDAFGANPGGLTLELLENSPHGVDLGPLDQRIPEVLRTPSGKIELAPDAITVDVARLRERLDAGGWNGHAPEFLLIGRRHLRSNNSWMHNLDALVKGKDRCTLILNPTDAERLGIAEGGSARIRSAAGELTAPVEISDEIMPGVVSVPHGWGHDVAGSKLSVAADHAGFNSNILSDESQVDVPSGNAVLSGIPVEVAAV
ncbi:molybdopterin-dependent oxidoreductase [soil metagenome]